MKKIFVLLFYLVFGIFIFSENLPGVIIAIIDNNLVTERKGTIYSIHLDNNDKINYFDSSSQEYRFPEKISELRVTENVVKKMIRKYTESNSESEMTTSVNNLKVMLKPLHTYKDKDAVVFIFSTPSLKKEDSDMIIEVSEIKYLEGGKIEIK